MSSGTNSAGTSVTAEQSRAMLCNDPSGLWLASRQEEGSEGLTPSGVYTNLVRLASKLSAATSSAEAKDDKPPAGAGATGDAASNNPAPSAAAVAAPLVTLETEEMAILIKEYDMHAVAIRVPAGSAISDSENGVPVSSESDAAPQES